MIFIFHPQAAPSAFATASLDDCGLDPQTLKVFCAGKVGGGGEQSDNNNIVRDLVFVDKDVVLDDDNNPTEVHLDIDYICVKLKVNY